MKILDASTFFGLKELNFSLIIILNSNLGEILLTYLVLVGSTQLH